MSDIIVRRTRSSRLSRIGLDRATGHALATVQTEAFLERASDEARRNLTLGRLSDIGVATRHGMDEAGEIASDLAARAERDPLGANAVGRIAETGIRGLDRELRRLCEGS